MKGVLRKSPDYCSSRAPTLACDVEERPERVLHLSFPMFASFAKVLSQCLVAHTCTDEGVHAYWHAYTFTHVAVCVPVYACKYLFADIHVWLYICVYI